jgi:phosphatidylinositol-3-phosphatase
MSDSEKVPQALDPKSTPPVPDPKKPPRVTAFTLFKRNRNARMAAMALIALVLSGTVVLVSHLANQPSQPPAPLVANAPSPSSSAFPSATPSAVTVKPSPPAKKPVSPAPPARKAPPPSSGPPSGTPHVMVIIEENKGYAATLGSCGSDPYFCSLAATYASDTSWFGVNHPSEPNYVALAAGSTLGCLSDSSCAANSLPQTDLGGQLTAKGIPWVGYMESMPSACYTGGSAGGYALKHNPFGFFKDNYRGTCHILPYPGVSGLVSALSASHPPDFVWITPNVMNDMHTGSVKQGDAWLRANLGPVLASPWFTAGNATVIVTMDENDAQASGTCCTVSTPGGQVPMVVISSDARGKSSFSSSGDHYGLLRSIEEAYGLGLLGAAANSVSGDLSALFGA